MHLLIATSGSSHSEGTLRLGAEIARHAGRMPTILTVIRDRADDARAMQVLARAQELLQPLLPGMATRTRVGQAAEEIVREAEDGDYDLLIVGASEQRNPVTRLFLGSPAERVVELAPCPVIIVKGRVSPIRRILLCDSGAGSFRLVRFTARVANLLEAEVEITVLHVMSQMSAGPGVNGEQLRASAEELMHEHTPEGELLARDMRVLKQRYAHCRSIVRHGLVVDEILAEAQQGDYDLVVIGAHRGAGWQHFLLDDLARQIIDKLDRPVLVVK